MKNLARLSALAFPVLLAAACSTTAYNYSHVIASVNVPEDERIVTDELSAVLEGDGVQKIVLRVPSPQANLTGEQAKQSNSFDEAYNTLEKELLKAGFTVRDRALLTEVLTDNPDIDYSSIRAKIDTDVILEVVSLREHDFSTSSYTFADSGLPGTAGAPLRMTGWRMEVKMIIVETGEIGAMYTLYYQDQTGYFILNPWGTVECTATENGTWEQQYTGYSVPLERAAKGFAAKVVDDLK